MAPAPPAAVAPINPFTASDEEKRAHNKAAFLLAYRDCLANVGRKVRHPDTGEEREVDFPSMRRRARRAYRIMHEIRFEPAWLEDDDLLVALELATRQPDGTVVYKDARRIALGPDIDEPLWCRRRGGTILP